MAKRDEIEIDGTSSQQGAPAPASGATQDESPSAPTGHASGRPYEPPPRRPKAERQNAFDLGQWLLEGIVGVVEEVRHNDLGLPEEFWVHAYAARKEALLAARALLERAIDACDDTEQSSPSTQKRRQRRGNVPIEFD